MPSNHYKPGDPCYLNLRFCNVSQVPIPDTPVFLLLDVFGDYFFAPGWSTTFDHYTLTIAPGQAMIEILPAFNWPSGTGSATGLLFYAALTDPGYTQILGEFDSWDISWSEL